LRTEDGDMISTQDRQNAVIVSAFCRIPSKTSKAGNDPHHSGIPRLGVRWTLILTGRLLALACR
jgi:hypothetical protein